MAGIADAVPDAECTLVWLHAPLETVFDRIRLRQPDPDWYLDAAKRMAEKIDPSQVADLVVDNAVRPPLEVADDILGQLGWT